MNAPSAAWTPRIIGIHSAAEFRGTSLRTSVCCYLHCYLVVKELNGITSAKKFLNLWLVFSHGDSILYKLNFASYLIIS